MSTTAPTSPEVSQDQANELSTRREDLRGVLGVTDSEKLGEHLQLFQPAEIAEVIDDEELSIQLKVIRAVPPEFGTEIFDDLDPDVQAAILAEFREWRAKHFLEEMAPDERADLFNELPDHLAQKFLSLLPTEEREDVEALLTHDESTAGGRMTTDFASVTPEMTVAETMAALRNEFRELEMIYYIYVVDAGGQLVGLLTLRYLLLADPDAKVGDIMHTNVISLHEDVDQEVVAQELALYDFVAMPIVNSRGQLVGIVTFDDVVDVLDDEAAEDQELFGGLSPSRDDYIDQTIPQGLQQRLPWLAMFLVLSSGSTFLLDFYQGAGYSGGFFLGVFALLPMVMAMAGNAATQTATLVIRALNIQDIKGKDVGRVIGRELLLGLMMGAVLAGLGFGRAWMTADATPILLGLTVAASLLIVMGLSTMIGAALPIMFHAVKLDPAVMSSPFIATFIDIISVFVFFQISIMAAGQIV
jgi:magnesium transporter